jgi:hypothetical protein
MTKVSDFVVVLGNNTETIGDDQILWESDRFSTAGRLADGFAFLTFMVKGLTQAASNVDVVIANGDEHLVGRIYRYNGANPAHWYTQTIEIGPGVLNNGPNTLRLVAVDIAGGGAGGDDFDDFSVRDIICFFQQEV